MDVWSRDPLAQSVKDRKRPIAALSVKFIRALQILLGSAGRSVFSLDKSLSWMPHRPRQQVRKSTPKTQLKKIVAVPIRSL
jgi:hypothetical protein